jgi:hypothetical protein
MRADIRPTVPVYPEGSDHKLDIPRRLRRRSGDTDVYFEDGHDQLSTVGGTPSDDKMIGVGTVDHSRHDRRDERIGPEERAEYTRSACCPAVFGNCMHVELAPYLTASGEPMPPGLGDWLALQGGSFEAGEAVALDLSNSQAHYRAEMAVNTVAREIGSSDHDHVILPDVDHKGVAHVIPVGSDHRPNVRHKIDDVPTRVESMSSRGPTGHAA